MGSPTRKGGVGKCSVCSVFHSRSRASLTRPPAKMTMSPAQVSMDSEYA